MREDRNQFQIIRKDARNCFVESLNDSSLSAGSIWPLLLMISRSRPVSARRTMSISILLWTSFWSCAESWIAVSCGICCKAKRKTAIIRRCRLSKKAAGRKSSINSGERTTRCRFLLLIYPKYCWPLRGAFFAFCVVRLLPYPYTPTEAHSLPLRPFRQPPSVSKT